MVLRHLANLSESTSKLRTAVLRARRIAEIGNFWYEFAPKGYIPLSDFYKIWHGGGSPRFAPSHQILAFWLSKCAYGQKKSPKMLVCGIHFPQSGIFLRQFLQNFALGGSPRTAQSCKISPL